MKSKIINFENVDYPQLCPKVVQYKNYSYYLTDKEQKWNKQLRDMYMESSLHSNILNNLNDMVFGTGFVPGNSLDEKRIKEFGYDDILKKLIFDYTLYGGAYLYIHWNNEHTKISKISHIKYDQIKIGDVDEMADDIEIYYHCTNWNKWKKKDITPLVKFNIDPVSDIRQTYTVKYNDLFIYPIPYYKAVIRNVQESIEIDKFYLHLSETGLGSSKLITIPGNMDDESQEELEYILKNNYSGSEGFKNIVLYPENNDFKPTIESINNEDVAVKYNRREEMLRGNIISGHGIPSPLLVGEKTPGSLGDGKEFSTAYTIYKRRYVYPFRDTFLTMFNDINEHLLNPLSQIKIDDIEFEFAEKQMPEDADVEVKVETGKEFTKEQEHWLWDEFEEIDKKNKLK